MNAYFRVTFHGTPGNPASRFLQLLYNYDQDKLRGYIYMNRRVDLPGVLHLNINKPILNSIQQYLPLLTLHLLQLDLNRQILNQL